jgi:hypothetical protein
MIKDEDLNVLPLSHCGPKLSSGNEALIARRWQLLKRPVTMPHPYLSEVRDDKRMCARRSYFKKEAK